MRLPPFLLDQWLDRYAAVPLPYNLAGSTGPSWTFGELLRLDPESTERLLNAPVSYQPSAGRSDVREAVAAMSGVDAGQILMTAGAAEALVLVFFLAASPGGNVVVPSPGFPTYHALPGALGLQLRTYDALTIGDGVDIAPIAALTDANTRLILVNTPHNPTGATVSTAMMRELHDFARSRRVQLVVDEVFHPIYHGPASESASLLPHATVINDLSKAFALPGLRIGWLREPDAERRAQYVNVREYLSVSNTAAGELLAGIAVRNRAIVHERTQRVTSANLARLEEFMAAQSARLRWRRPGGGTTAFIQLRHVADTRPFCMAAAEEGLLLVPGDCFYYPGYVRVGLGVPTETFAEAIDVFGALLSRGS